MRTPCTIAFLSVLIVASGLRAESFSYYISRYPAAVVPERMLTIPMREPGKICIHHQGEGRITKGTLLVSINADELELEEAELKNRQRHNTAIAHEALMQLQRRREELEFILAQPAERRLYTEERLKLKASQRALDILNEKIAIQEEQLRIDNEKLQQEYNNRHESRVIKMPFDGRVQYHIIPGEEKEMLLTQAGALLTAVDDKALYAAIIPGDASLLYLPTEKLQLHLNSGQKTELRASWHHNRVEQRNNREVLVCYFLIAAQDYEKAWSLIGTNCIAELYYKTTEEEKLLYVSKYSLAEEARSESFETWESLVSTLRPGYRILFIGETHLCLFPAVQS